MGGGYPRTCSFTRSLPGAVGESWAGNGPAECEETSWATQVGCPREGGGSCSKEGVQTQGLGPQFPRASLS